MAEDNSDTNAPVEQNGTVETQDGIEESAERSDSLPNGEDEVKGNISLSWFKLVHIFRLRSILDLYYTSLSIFVAEVSKKKKKNKSK